MKDCILIGNKNAITYKETFKLIKEKKIWLGYTHPQKFITPDGNTTDALNGLERFFGNIQWFATEETKTKPLILTKHYTPEEYPKYDNYDAINVNKIKDIPCDYDGVMGVPITFLDYYTPDWQMIQICNDCSAETRVAKVDGKEKYCRILIKKKDDLVPVQFDILGCTCRRYSPEYITKTYDNNDWNGSACINDNGMIKMIYSRLLIKKRGIKI